MKLVLIEWEDAHSSNGWQKMSAIKANGVETLPCRNVGWLVKKTKKQTVLTHALSDENLKDSSGHGHFTIPNAMIRKVTVLRKNG